MNNLKKQRGLSMLLALIALLVLSLTAVALVRSVDTGTMIIGNYSFKQDATEVSSAGAQTAMNWLQANQGKLNSDVQASGYYAASLDNLDPTGSTTTAANPLELVDWDGTTDCPTVKAGTYTTCTRQPFPLAVDAAKVPVNGNTVQCIITRLCKSQGAPSPTKAGTR